MPYKVIPIPHKVILNVNKVLSQNQMSNLLNIQPTDTSLKPRKIYLKNGSASSLSYDSLI